MMKAFTDIKQSKKLADILPIDSADAYYTVIDQGLFLEVKQGIEPSKEDIPCWSLAALLSVLPNSQGRYTKSLYWFDGAWHCEYVDEDGEGVFGTSADNAIDACYEMILNLL